MRPYIYICIYIYTYIERDRELGMGCDRVSDAHVYVCIRVRITCTYGWRGVAMCDAIQRNQPWNVAQAVTCCTSSPLPCRSHRSTCGSDGRTSTTLDEHEPTTNRIAWPHECDIPDWCCDTHGCTHSEIDGRQRATISCTFL